MQVTTLKNPGDSPLSQTVRKEVARVISQLEDADVTGTPSPLFAAFLADAAAKTPGYAGPVLPTTQKLLSSGVKVPVGTVTGTGTFFTPTIVNGVITGGVLSAS